MIKVGLAFHALPPPRARHAPASVLRVQLGRTGRTSELSRRHLIFLGSICFRLGSLSLSFLFSIPFFLNLGRPLAATTEDGKALSRRHSCYAENASITAAVLVVGVVDLKRLRRTPTAGHFLFRPLFVLFCTYPFFLCSLDEPSRYYSTMMPSSLAHRRVVLIAGLILLVMMPISSMGFHIPHANHQHPLYIQYYLKERLLDKNEIDKKHPAAECCLEQAREDSSRASAKGASVMNQEYIVWNDNHNNRNHKSNTISRSLSLFRRSRSEDDSEQQQLPNTSAATMIPTTLLVDATISTPISYDAETGMVQTAVRAIVQNPMVTNFVQHQVVAVSSTLVISLGALHELVDCLELELAHHATSSTEGLAILSLGHALHYGRETLRQLLEMDHGVEETTSREQRSKSNIRL